MITYPLSIFDKSLNRKVLKVNFIENIFFLTQTEKPLNSFFNICIIKQILIPQI